MIFLYAALGYLAVSFGAIALASYWTGVDGERADQHRAFLMLVFLVWPVFLLALPIAWVAIVTNEWGMESERARANDVRKVLSEQKVEAKKRGVV